MLKKIIIPVIIMIATGGHIFAQPEFEIDTFSTPGGKLEIWCIGHGTLMFKLNNFVLHVDPVSREADYDLLPDADVILVTHSHGDHLDPGAISKIMTPATSVFCNESSAKDLDGAIILMNGDKYDFAGPKDIKMLIEAVPAYNIKHERSPGLPFHPKGDGNGYIINLAGKRIYIAGDTENIPEMEDIKAIDIAFIPMNLPYTMSVDMAVDAGLKIKPAYLYPYHFGTSNTAELAERLKNTDIEVRIRKF